MIEPEVCRELLEQHDRYTYRRCEVVRDENDAAGGLWFVYFQAKAIDCWQCPSSKPTGYLHLPQALAAAAAFADRRDAGQVPGLMPLLPKLSYYQEPGPIYSQLLIDSLPINGGFTQQMASREDLEGVRKRSERVAAAYEVLMNHYRQLRNYVDG